MFSKVVSNNWGPFKLFKRDSTPFSRGNAARTEGSFMRYIKNMRNYSSSAFILIDDENILPVKVIDDNAYLRSAGYGLISAMRPLQSAQIAKALLRAQTATISPQGDPFLNLLNMSMAMFHSGNYVSALAPTEACLIQLLNGQHQSFVLKSQDHLINVSNMYLRCLRETGQLNLIKTYDSKMMTLASLRQHHELLALWSCYEGLYHGEYALEEKGRTASDAINMSKHYLHAALNLYTEKLKPRCTPTVLQRARENIRLPALKGLVFMHYQSGDFALAEKFAKKAIKAASSVSSNHTLEPLCQYAAILVKTSQFEEAKKLYHKALVLAEHPKERSQVLYGLAKVCVVLQMFDEGFHYLEEYVATERTRQAPSSRNVAKSLLSIGLTYNKKGDKEKALRHAEESLKMAIELDDHQLAQQASHAIDSIQFPSDSSPGPQ